MLIKPVKYFFIKSLKSANIYTIYNLELLMRIIITDRDSFKIIKENNYCGQDNSIFLDGFILGRGFTMSNRAINFIRDFKKNIIHIELDFIDNSSISFFHDILLGIGNNIGFSEKDEIMIKFDESCDKKFFKENGEFNLEDYNVIKLFTTELMKNNLIDDENFILNIINNNNYVDIYKIRELIIINKIINYIRKSNDFEMLIEV